MLPPQRRRRIVLRVLVIIGFIGAGLNHFRNPAFYQRIIPPGFPAPAVLVVVSGICEIAGGVGLAIQPLRRAAGWGLIALLVAVFPANIYMAVCPDQFADLHFSTWMLWLRLPLQGILVWWVWMVI